MKKNIKKIIGVVLFAASLSGVSASFAAQEITSSDKITWELINNSTHILRVTLKNGSSQRIGRLSQNVFSQDQLKASMSGVKQTVTQEEIGDNYYEVLEFTTNAYWIEGHADYDGGQLGNKDKGVCYKQVIVSDDHKRVIFGDWDSATETCSVR